MNLQSKTIAIIGLGYVGLPLAVEFGKQRPTIGFDINQARIHELQSGKDHTLECCSQELQSAKQLKYSANFQELQQAQVFIVTVPTPVDPAIGADQHKIAHPVHGRLRSHCVCAKHVVANALSRVVLHQRHMLVGCCVVNPLPTNHPRIMKAHEEFLQWDELHDRLQALSLALDLNDVPHIRKQLNELVPGYQPEGEVVDWVWMENEKLAAA